MAWLLLDVGNTAIKWAYREGDDHRLVGSGLALRAASDPLAQRLAKAWRGLQATRAFGVSVADAATMQAVEEAAQAAAGISVKWLAAQPHFAGRGPGYGLALINAYREPAQLGPDRWHALIAACAKFPGESLVVASGGTATTVDCVRAEPGAAAVFVGGVIAPGFELMQESLARGTARLPDTRTLVTGRVAPHPDNTEDAIVTGVFQAQAGVVERVVADFAVELSGERRPPPRLLLAGGRARSLQAALGDRLRQAGYVAAVSVEENLVLRGVALRAQAEIDADVASSADR